MYFFSKLVIDDIKPKKEIKRSSTQLDIYGTKRRRKIIKYEAFNTQFMLVNKLY